MVPAYLIALAPVIAAGRPTLSSYMALTDSAVHMLGADYLVHHGQTVRAPRCCTTPTARYLEAYYQHGYPSGADTLFGGSALLLRLSLFFAYQPFNAFMLAIATGPAWLLLRWAGLRDCAGRARRGRGDGAGARVRLRAGRRDQGNRDAAAAARPRRCS